MKNLLNIKHIPFHRKNYLQRVYIRILFVYFVSIENQK